MEKGFPRTQADAAKAAEQSYPGMTGADAAEYVRGEKKATRLEDQVLKNVSDALGFNPDPLSDGGIKKAVENALGIEVDHLIILAGTDKENHLEVCQLVGGRTIKLIEMVMQILENLQKNHPLEFAIALLEMQGQ